MSTGSDYFDGQQSRDAEVESLREQLVQRDRRVAELEAACRKLCTWADNPLPNDPGVQAEWVETVRTVRAALSVPRRSFAHEDPNAPPSAERIEYAEKRAAYLGELLNWKTAPAAREATTICRLCYPNQRMLCQSCAAGKTVPPTPEQFSSGDFSSKHQETAFTDEERRFILYALGHCGMYRKTEFPVAADRMFAVADSIAAKLDATRAKAPT